MSHKRVNIRVNWIRIFQLPEELQLDTGYRIRKNQQVEIVLTQGKSSIRKPQDKKKIVCL